MHGGRQEGKYSSRTDLMSTHGCMRINDKDIKELKEITDKLESSDPQESKGSLVVSNDLQEPIKYDEDRHDAGLDQFPVSSNQTSTELQNQYNLSIPPAVRDNTDVKQKIHE